MLFARAATKVLLAGGDLHDGHKIVNIMRDTVFEGVGSQVALDNNGDRINSYDVMNWVMKDGKMDSVRVGTFNHTTTVYIAEHEAVIWPGNTTKVPRDFVNFVDETKDGEGRASIIIGGVFGAALVATFAGALIYIKSHGHRVRTCACMSRINASSNCV